MNRFGVKSLVQVKQIHKIGQINYNYNRKYKIYLKIYSNIINNIDDNIIINNNKKQIKRNISVNPRDQILKCDPSKMIPGFKPLIREDKPTSYNITKLDSGVTILTEDSAFPFHTDINIIGQFGTRNETQKNGGAMRMLNNLLFMSGDNQTILENYELNQLNGGGVQMSYDQETTSYKCQCIPEDTETMLDLLMKMAIQPKNFSMFDASQLQEEVGHMIFEQQFLKAAYDGKSVGMCDINPEMSEKDFIEFQNQFVTPSRLIISASNVKSHQYFVDLVTQSMKKYPEFLKRKFTANPYPSTYVGKDLRIETENDLVEVGIGFKSVDWNHPDMIVYQVIFTMIGNSSYFSTGGPGKGMHSRATKNRADCISNIFTDTGFFGLKLLGHSENVNDLLQACINEIGLLTKPISPIELQRSKNILKSLISLALERQQDRLEEASKHIINFNKVQIQEAERMIDRVTYEDINRVAKTFIKGSRPTITIIGQGANRAWSFEKIAANILSL